MSTTCPCLEPSYVLVDSIVCGLLLQYFWWLADVQHGCSNHETSFVELTDNYGDSVRRKGANKVVFLQSAGPFTDGRFVVKKMNAELRAAENNCSVLALPRGMSCASVICFGVEKVEAFRSLSPYVWFNETP